MKIDLNKIEFLLGQTWQEYKDVLNILAIIKVIKIWVSGKIIACEPDSIDMDDSLF